VTTLSICCDNCGIEFKRKSDHYNNRKNNFCTTKCYGEWLSKTKVGEAHPRYSKKPVKCSVCNKTLYRNPWQIKRNTNHFCGTKCAGKWKSKNQLKENHPCWNGGKYTGKNGYVYVYTGNARERAEHIVMAEEILGRPFKKGEVVHHINMDKSDNRKENMVICTNSYHHSLHQRMARLYATEKFGDL